MTVKKILLFKKKKEEHVVLTLTNHLETRVVIG